MNDQGSLALWLCKSNPYIVITVKLPNWRRSSLENCTSSVVSTYIITRLETFLQLLLSMFYLYHYKHTLHWTPTIQSPQHLLQYWELIRKLQKLALLIVNKHPWEVSFEVGHLRFEENTVSLSDPENPLVWSNLGTMQLSELWRHLQVYSSSHVHRIHHEQL